jgi:CubicO group peptidase (beta-lactamase class C family)
MTDFSRVENVVRELLDKTFPAAQIVIRVHGEVVYANAFGHLDPDTQLLNTQPDTRFDFASVSKLFTVAAFMTFVEQGRVALDQPVCELLPEFVGARALEPYSDPFRPGAFVEVVPPSNARVDAGRVTFRNLLAHNSGLPAWLPLWTLPARQMRRATALTCAFAYPTGAHVIYSDIGLILVGFALEALGGKSLDAVVGERVTSPLGLESIGYGPLPPDNVAPTEWYAHQNRRMRGEVHDENAWSFGGVAGHAGLFGNARDLAVFGEALRTNRLLTRETLAEMTRVQAHEGALRRGIGFVLWSPDPDAAGNPLSEQAFGHTGFTGTSLWIDPARDLVIACLTNRVYYGRDDANAIIRFRVAFHRTIVEILDAAGRK